MAAEIKIPAITLLNVAKGELRFKSTDRRNFVENRARVGYAARWISEQPVVESEQKEITKALVALLSTPGHGAEAAVAEALAHWATKDNVPDLVKIASGKDNPSHAGVKAIRRSAMMALARLKDPRGVAAIMSQWNNLYSEKAAVDALVEMGSLAEDAVIGQLLTGNSFHSRARACNVLTQIGTKKSLEALDLVYRRDTNPNVKREVAKAYLAIQQRLKSQPEPEKK